MSQIPANYIKTAYTETLTEILQITTHNTAHSTMKHCVSWYEIH